MATSSRTVGTPKPAPTITSRQNPIVARFRAAARGDAAALLLDGVHLVAEAIASSTALREIAILHAAANESELAPIVDYATRQGTSLVLVSAPVMGALSPVRSASRIVALADRPSAHDERIYQGRALAVIALDVQDPGNIGAIVRSAEAFGATGLVAAGDSADPFGWKALRGSMGSALRLPIAVRCDRTAAIEDARRHGCRIVATVARGGRPPAAVDLTGASAILIGGEGAGLPDDIAALADERVTIPMRAPVESLNAAVTAALVVYEAARQRTI